MTKQPDIAALLEALGVGDETLRTLLVATGQGRQAVPQAAPALPSLRGGSRPDPEETSEALKQANEALHDQLELLACALGACPACWGADPDCTECGGAGKPGAFLPDEACFRHFVLPVIHRISRSLGERSSKARALSGETPADPKPMSGKGDRP